MKTAELTGAALDWAVAEAGGVPIYRSGKTLSRMDMDGGVYWQPSTDWWQGGPIMEREGIGATVVSPSGDEMWLGANYKGRFAEYGATCLVACMRTYVTSKLGEDVEIPKELI